MCHPLTNASAIVVIHLRAGPNADILRKAKYQVDRSAPFSVVQRLLRSLLHLEPKDNLFVYCSAAFCPTPDAVVGDLFDCFAVNNELPVHYCRADAWG